MAKRKRKEKCKTNNCMVHKWFPKIKKHFGHQVCPYVDPTTGEIFIATGLRALPDLEVVEMELGINYWVDVRCTCGNESSQRVDLLESGKIRSCPTCAANQAYGERN